MGIQGPADDPHGVHQVAEPLQRVVFPLDRHQNGVCRAEGVEGQQLQGGRAVNKQEVIAVLDLIQRVLQQKLPAVHADQLDAGTGQGLVGGKHIAVLSVDQGVLHRHLADQSVVNSLGDRLVHSHAGGGVGLRVKVAQKDPLARLSQGRGQIHTGGGLSHAAFLIYDCDGLCHGAPTF